MIFEIANFLTTLPSQGDYTVDHGPGPTGPQETMARLIHCPACRGLVEFPIALTSGHVFHECMAVEGIFVDYA